MQEVPHAQNDRSLGELFGDLSREVSNLVRQEMKLFKAEMGEKVSHVGKDAGMIAAGGALAYAGLLALVASFILILTAIGLPAWASALIVGLVVAGGGAFMAKSGLDALKRVDLTPRETLETLKEDQNAVTAVRRRAA